MGKSFQRKPRPDNLMDILHQLASGELSRDDACRLCGVSYSTLKIWSQQAGIGRSETRQLWRWNGKQQRFEEAVGLWLSNQITVAEAARRCDVSYRTFMARCRDVGIEKKFPGEVVPADLMEVSAQWWAGETSQEGMARKYGVSRDTVRKWCRTLGIQAPPPHRRTLAPANFDEVAKLWSERRISTKEARERLGASEWCFRRWTKEAGLHRMRRSAVGLERKSCAMCHGKFQPVTRRQIYCPDCARKKRVEQEERQARREERERRAAARKPGKAVQKKQEPQRVAKSILSVEEGAARIAAILGLKELS